MSERYSAQTPWVRTLHWVIGSSLLLLLSLLVASNIFFASSLDPKLAGGLLAMLATLALLAQPSWRQTSSRQTSPRLPPTGLLVLLFTASAWNYFVNAKAEAGYVHYHDAGHYYLGSRYFDELGYFHLYDGFLLALTDSEAAIEPPEQARDLRDNKLVSSAEILSRRRLATTDFEPARWRQFQGDVEMIHQGLGQRTEAFLKDHGYNPTPVWTWLTSYLAKSIPPGSKTGLFLLCLIDPLLLAAALGALWWARGRDVALIAGSYLFVIFGTANWIGGSFCRYLWLALLICGYCFLVQKRYVWAGSMLGIATALRIFPGLFLLPLLIKVFRVAVRGRPIPGRLRRLLAGFGVTMLAIVAGATFALGTGAWLEFAQNMNVYLKLNPSNAIGLQTILGAASHALGVDPTSLPSNVLIATLSGVGALTLTFAASRSRELSTLAAGAALIFLIFDLGGYYYGLMVIPLLVEVDHRRGLAAFFGVEFACYLAHFMLSSEPHVLFLIKSLLIGLLLSSLWLDHGVREMGARWQVMLRGHHP